MWRPADDNDDGVDDDDVCGSDDGDGVDDGVVGGVDDGVDDGEYLRKAWKVFGGKSDFPVPRGRKASRQSISAPTSYNLIIFIFYFAHTIFKHSE